MRVVKAPHVILRGSQGCEWLLMMIPSQVHFSGGSLATSPEVHVLGEGREELGNS